MFDKREAATVLLDEEMASDVFDGKYSSVVGEAKIAIYELGAGYECDQAVFIARLKKVVEIRTEPYASVHKEKVAC